MVADAQAAEAGAVMMPEATVYLPEALAVDERRGTRAMVLFILSEAMLFVMLFFSYFYLGRNDPRWPMHPPPKLLLASIMLAVLAASSVVLYLAERAAESGRDGAARAGVIVTLLLAMGFVVLQVFEYRDHLRTLKPTTDAYGSIFYTITSFHAAHLLLGMAMLVYVAMLPRLAHTGQPPHRPLTNAALYWHFVDAVWVVVVAVLYVAPHVIR
jgi:heme/copper-type cytochrome/quinol oxidase subunit 3